MRLGASAVTLERVVEHHLTGEERLEALFVDGDADLCQRDLPSDTGQRVAIVALVGSEVPSHLSRLLRLSVSAHIMKPVRSVGILSALTFARQSFRDHRELADQVDKLEDRLRQRRFVFAAQLALMEELGISESAAFARLRGAAMERRTTIEEISVEFLADRKNVQSLI